MIGATPFTACDEGHRSLVRDLTVQLDCQPEILGCWNSLIAIQFEATGADIGKIPNNLLGGIVQYLHVVRELTAV